MKKPVTVTLDEELINYFRENFKNFSGAVNWHLRNSVDTIKGDGYLEKNYKVVKRLK